VLSCRTKEAKLLCLKFLGRRSRSNSARRHTTNAVPDSFQEMVSSVPGSSTIAYVLMRNGGAGGDAIKHLEVGWVGVVARGGDDGRMRFTRKEWSRNGDFVTG
jgi:hypothetical protein